MRRYPAWLVALSLAGCAGPDVVGQQVGQSLYNASVNTGHALAVAGDRTGSALQNAGTNLRNAVDPPPPAYQPPPTLPPPYVPPDFDSQAPDHVPAASACVLAIVQPGRLRPQPGQRDEEVERRRRHTRQTG